MSIWRWELVVNGSSKRGFRFKIPWPRYVTIDWTHVTTIWLKVVTGYTEVKVYQWYTGSCTHDYRKQCSSISKVRERERDKDKDQGLIRSGVERHQRRCSTTLIKSHLLYPLSCVKTRCLRIRIQGRAEGQSLRKRRYVLTITIMDGVSW